MKTIATAQAALANHPIYESLNNIESIRHFMRYHVFAVWDFMSLLKSLQNKVTCVSVPWTPSPYPTEMVRFINQIVVGEESDLDQFGNPTSHFDLYLKGMEEVGASTAEIRDFLSDLDVSRIPSGVREFVQYNLDVARKGHAVEVASSFFFGREKLIPGMFQSIVDTLKREKVNAPTFLYYLERHIDVDGNEHGPLALKCLDRLTEGKPELLALSEKTATEALTMRKALWDFVLVAQKR